MNRRLVSVSVGFSVLLSAGIAREVPRSPAVDPVFKQVQSKVKAKAFANAIGLEDLQGKIDAKTQREIERTSLEVAKAMRQMESELTIDTREIDREISASLQCLEVGNMGRDSAEFRTKQVKADVPPIHINLPHINVNVPPVHVRIPKMHFKQGGRQFDIPEVKVDVPAIHLDVRRIKVDIPAIHVNVPPIASHPSDTGR